MSLKLKFFVHLCECVCAALSAGRNDRFTSFISAIPLADVENVCCKVYHNLVIKFFWKNLLHTRGL